MSPVVRRALQVEAFPESWKEIFAPVCGIEFGRRGENQVRNKHLCVLTSLRLC